MLFLKRFYSTKPLFDKILIANRGEIACRIIKTCKRLGIRTVAVYSEADSNALHVKQVFKLFHKKADEAYCIGKPPSSESYLNMEKILEVAKQSSTQAIHPGYGFLSENPTFVEKVEQSGLTFIGPPASAMISMGSKSASKQIMTKANVPVVPGYHGENQEVAFLKQKAEEIGYPVLIKAVKGGGGKGMRRVDQPEDFEMMLASAKREAQKSFGDDKVLVEKYLITPRHVEVQVFCDKLGKAVYLFERDCSVQRRHQKIIEEAPAPNLSEETRKLLGEKAVAAALAVNYVGAGTVEFIMDSETQQFYFMEMNTRLQVEHPVTEMITGTDLVDWQIQVAAGNPLPLNQNQLKINGHSFEARIYAENPRNQFLPDVGTLHHLLTPEPADDLRVETGIRQSDQVSIYYDPMIAKLVVWGQDRTSALRKLRKGLGAFQVVGCHTNIEFLKSLSKHEKFIQAELETGFIPKYEKDLFPALEAPSSSVLAQAALSLLLSQQPKHDLFFGFRLNHAYSQQYEFENEQQTFKVVCELIPNDPNHYRVKIYSGEEQVDQLMVYARQLSDREYEFEVEGRRLKTQIVLEKQKLIHLFENNDSHHQLKWKLPDFSQSDVSAGGDQSSLIKAPMNSKLSQVLVQPGQKVTKGTPVVILEAMKMEHVLRATKDGVVKSIRGKAGDMIADQAVVVSIE